MELWIIWGVITAFTIGFRWSKAIIACAGIMLFLWACYADSQCSKWEKAGCLGDHPYLEWIRCKYSWRSAMNKYDADRDCKISFDDFQKYFAVNPSRYRFNISSVNFNDGSKNIIMVFPRKDLFRFFLFRRNYLQSRRMVDVINAVQEDIDKLREDAQEQLDKAKAALNTDFKAEQS